MTDHRRCPAGECHRAPTPAIPRRALVVPFVVALLLLVALVTLFAGCAGLPFRPAPSTPAPAPATSVLIVTDCEVGYIVTEVGCDIVGTANDDRGIPDPDLITNPPASVPDSPQDESNGPEATVTPSTTGATL